MIAMQSPETIAGRADALSEREVVDQIMRVL
jgi:hypothetical protein